MNKNDNKNETYISNWCSILKTIGNGKNVYVKYDHLIEIIETGNLKKGLITISISKLYNCVQKIYNIEPIKWKHRLYQFGWYNWKWNEHVVFDIVWA